MEIRDPLHGAIEVSPPEAAIIDSRFFQRLRNIKQLGFTEFSFPGGTHNRYCHSLGAMHLAGLAVDRVFKKYIFKSPETRWRLRQCVRLASLLHDVGHGPLSHTTEEVMPLLSELDVKIYGKVRSQEKRRAHHEDYTIKILTDSELTKILEQNFPDVKATHVACLIDQQIEAPDDFFLDGGISLRPLLSQIVSSELDVDRMDYLARDSYYCGTSYGHVDSDWLMANLVPYQKDKSVYLALNRQALYTFDDFLISRYHMYLMVYFHHKAIIYDEMLLRYLRSPDCDFALPSQVDEYIQYDDYSLHSHMAQSKNRWAKLIANRHPHRRVFESHDQKTKKIDEVEKVLKDARIETIRAGSTGRLSKYYGTGKNETLALDLYVVDDSAGSEKNVTKIQESTEIFEKYQDARKIERLYVSQEDFARAKEIISTF